MSSNPPTNLEPATMGDLRSWMHQDQLDPQQRQALWQAVQFHGANSPKDYEQVWQPYLAQFPQHFAQPLAFLTSIEELSLAFTLLPFALFSLGMPRERLEDTGLKALASSPQLGCLTYLDLYSNEIGDEGLKALANSPFANRLTYLELALNHISDEGVKALANSPHLAHLITLDLSDNQIGDEGAKALASSPFLSHLTTLDLSDNQVDEEGAKALANSPTLSESVREQYDWS